MVCCGASLSITAMSPNWRSASTRTTGRSVRIARDTPRLLATTDLPAPPFVENTVMTRPRLPSDSVGDLGHRHAVGPDGLLDAADRLTELRGVDRRGEHVAHAAADRPLEDVGGQLLGDEDGADVGPLAEHLLGAHQPRCAGARRAEHDHDRIGTDVLRERFDGGVAGDLLAELHGEPVAGGLVDLYDDESSPRLCHRFGHVFDSR